MQDKLKGLSRQEVEASREKYGSNSLKKEKRKGFLGRFLSNMSDPIIRVLLIAVFLEVVFTLGKCNWFEVGGMVMAVLIATGVSTISEMGSEKAFENIERLEAEQNARVLRDGKIQSISINDIVVGDIIYLSGGGKIPADARVISGKVSVDQSALNGESIEVQKDAKSDTGAWDLSNNSRVFRGSFIENGEAIAKVGRVGESTYYGMVAKDVQAETRQSPLKRRLSHLASQISKIGYVLAIVVAVAYLFNMIVINNGFDMQNIVAYLRDTKTLLMTLLNAFTLMITVIVVAVPEGLPMMITVVLSANMKKMISDKVLVKKLVGIETAGSMNILFTDKTGTVTEGRPDIYEIITYSGTYHTERELRQSGRVYELLNLNAKYNTDTKGVGNTKTGGNSTDQRLFEYFKDVKNEEYKVVDYRGFTSESKSSTVTIIGKNEKLTLHKGAPERILPLCNSIVSCEGKCIASDLQTMRRAYFERAERGERVIAVACDDGGGALALIALVVLKDKIRSGVKTSVAKMHSAGIMVVMVTGDSIKTASAIARECGILSGSSREMVIDSETLNKMSDSEVKANLDRIKVIARALPQDKTRLVRLSQELDLVVGMTGDGINDAPSLKLADVGFAMGSGTDIAKNAGDIVILDNSFSALERTVLYGRTIFKSIRKFITFQLVMNLTACGVSLIGQFIGVETPITIIQMLWINIIMDTLGGLAFAGEPALDYYMQEKPKRRDEPILDKKMLKNVALRGAFTLCLCTLFLSLGIFKDIFGYYSDSTRFLTAFYALFIFCGLINSFLARSERFNILSNISKNKPFLFIMLLIFSVQLCMIYFGGALFRTVPLSINEILITLLLSFLVLLFDIIKRVFEKLV